MSSHNLFSALRAAFPSDLQATAVETDEGLRYSWADLERATAMMANLLKSLDLPEGSRVAVQVEKSVEAMMLYLATLRAGYVFLPLNTAYQSAEIEYFIGNAEPAVVVCSGANFGWVSKIAFKAGTQHVFTLNDDRTGSLLDRAAHHSDQHQTVSRKADDLAAILYTSGTTGRSKGAMLTHGNMLSNALTLKDYWGWKTTGGPDGHGDVLIHALPIFHVHGLFVAIHGALINGSKMIWMAKFDPKRAIAHMAKASVFMGVPTLYVRMLAESSLNKAAVKNMRLFIAGSAPLLIETFTEWQARTGHTILERYGMSETAMLTSNPYAADKRYAKPRQTRVTDSSPSAEAARWAFLCRMFRCACAATMVWICRWVRSVASRSKAPMCSKAIGACPKKRPKSSQPMGTSRPVTWARSMSEVMSPSWVAART